MAVSQNAEVQYYDAEGGLSETQKAVTKATKYFKNMNECLTQLSDEINIFNSTQLKTDIVHIPKKDSKTSNTFYYKPTKESIEFVEGFKKNISTILKQYYNYYSALNKYFEDFGDNYSKLRRAIGNTFDKKISSVYEALQPLRLNIQTLCRDAIGGAKNTEILSDLESVVTCIPHTGENELFNGINLTASQVLNAVKTYDRTRLLAKVNELDQEYKSLVLNLKSSFNEINIFENKVLTERAKFLKLLDNCRVNTEKVVKLVYNLNKNLYEGGFGTEFSCNECDKYAINESVHISIRFDVLRKDLHQLPNELNNFDNELVPSKTKVVKGSSEEEQVKKRKEDYLRLAKELNQYSNIAWLKPLEEDAFLNEQLVRDGIRYAFSQKKNLLYRGFYIIGDKVKDGVYRLGDILRDKLHIPEKTLPKMDLDASVILEAMNKKPITVKGFNTILKESKKDYGDINVNNILEVINKNPMTAEEFSTVFNKAREESYLRNINKKGISPPRPDVVSGIARRPNINKAYEIKYFLEDKVGTPAKKFLKEKIGTPVNFVEKTAKRKNKTLVKEKDEDQEPSLSEKIKTFFVDNVTDPWYYRFPQLSLNTYDSLKNNAARRDSSNVLHSKLAINNIPKYRQSLIDITSDAIVKYKKSKEKVKPIDASSDDPVINARMNDEYCRPCFETLDKKSVTLDPKKVIIETIAKVFVQSKMQEALEKPFIPMLVPDIDESKEDRELVLTTRFNKKYYGDANYEPETGYGLYSKLGMFD